MLFTGRGNGRIGFSVCFQVPASESSCFVVSISSNFVSQVSVSFCISVLLSSFCYCSVSDFFR